jgi:hypothetical protein
MTHTDLYLAGLSIEERNEVLDQWAYEAAVDARAEAREAARRGE